MVVNGPHNHILHCIQTSLIELAHTPGQGCQRSWRGLLCPVQRSWLCCPSPELVWGFLGNETLSLVECANEDDQTVHVYVHVCIGTYYVSVCHWMKPELSLKCTVNMGCQVCQKHLQMAHLYISFGHINTTVIYLNICLIYIHWPDIIYST